MTYNALRKEIFNNILNYFVLGKSLVNAYKKFNDDKRSVSMQVAGFDGELSPKSKKKSKSFDPTQSDRLFSV